MKRIIAAVAVGTSTLLAVAACGLSNNPFGGSGSANKSGPIVVGSANFTESQLLGEIFYQALLAKGVQARETPNVGSRETYFPGLQDGSIDLVPDYSGTLLQYLNSKAAQSSPQDVYAALQENLPAGLVALNMAAAQDKDAVVVTKATAEKYHATSIADLAQHCGELVFGGPPEFQTRPDGIPGIQKHYNCAFQRYQSLAPGVVTAKALQSGTIAAADIFTTDPSIPLDGFVALSDPDNDFSAQNVVPIINANKASPEVKRILNAVSAKLDTNALIALDTQLNAPSKPATATVAKRWLQSVGLG